MPDPSHIAQIADTLFMPLIGGIALLTAKLSVGEAARTAERNFFVALIVITAITLRTVITCDEIWFVHTSTLGLMIVGSLVIPSQDSPSEGFAVLPSESIAVIQSESSAVMQRKSSAILPNESSALL